MNKRPVSYKQYDKRWAAVPYNGPGEKDKTIKSSGCGPTCAAMCIAALKAPKVTPVETCAWSRAHGYKYANQGTAYGYFAPQMAAYGIACRQLLPSRIINKPDHPIHGQVKSYLAQGYWVIALMGTKSPTQRGFWTSGGHYILVWDWDSKVRILDPISASAARANGDPATFRNEVRQYWLVDARKYNGKDGDSMTVEEVKKIAEGAATTAAAKAVAEAMAKDRVYNTVAQCPQWSQTAVAWAVKAGYIKGDEQGMLRLDDSKVWALQVTYNIMEKDKETV